MGGVDFLDSNIGCYRIDGRGKNWHWSHHINTIDVLKSSSFKVFPMSNPEIKTDFLTYIRRIVVTHYLKIAKMQKQIFPNIIYPPKKSWKGESVTAGKIV